MQTQAVSYLAKAIYTNLLVVTLRIISILKSTNFSEIGKLCVYIFRQNVRKWNTGPYSWYLQGVMET